MPTSPSSPQTGSVVRSTMLFKVLRGGREKKLGRALTEPELLELEAHAARSAAAGVHTAKERNLSETAKAMVASLPKALPEKLLNPTSHKLPFRKGGQLTGGARRRAGRAIEDVRVLLRMAVKNGVGPNMPIRAMRTSAIYIQQDDLEQFIPDGWGADFSAEAAALGRDVGLPPSAIPLMCLLSWTSSFRPAIEKDKHECGSGFQVSLDWLTRKMGCSRVWVQHLLNLLDPCAMWRRECLEVNRENRRRAKRQQAALPKPQRPQGTVFLHRYRRLKLYEDVHPEGAVRRIWVDAKGNHHRYVDVRGVIYLTQAGRKVLSRPRQSLEAAVEVDRKGLRSRWILSARLRRGHNLITGGHVGEVLESRRELLGREGVPENLSPNHLLLETPQPS